MQSGASNQAPDVRRLIDGWRESAAEVFPLDPVSGVVDFETLWRWMLPNLLLSETRQAAEELRVVVEVTNN